MGKGLTYIYRNDELELMCGTALITTADNADVMRGEKVYVVRMEDRGNED